MNLRVLPYGDRALLLELPTEAAVLPVRDAVLRLAEPSITAVVPAARTVLVEFDPGSGTVEQLRRQLIALRVLPADAAPPAMPIELPVRYDGADLVAVADAVGLAVDELITLHSGAEYTVLFCGFSPGFGYLTGLPERLRMPRLDAPRRSVPAGSVAIADGFAGVYPRASPGGWRLLGRTDAVLFDLDRQPPALLAPGTRVRFRPQ